MNVKNKPRKAKQRRSVTMMATSLGIPLFSIKADSGNNKKENNTAMVSGMKNVLPRINNARITVKMSSKQATRTYDGCCTMK